MKPSIENKYEPRELHCTHCGRFLGYENIIEGAINILCPKCKGFTEFEILVNLSIDKNSDK